MTQNQQAKTVDLADVFGSVVNQLRTDKSQINTADANGTHGNDIVNDFEQVANALNGMRGQDAGSQLRQAASILQQNGKSTTANGYAQGLLEAAQRLEGKTGITANEVLPLVQGLVSGVQRQSNGQPEQSGLLNTLLPAVTSYANARNNNGSHTNAVSEALNVISGSGQQAQQQNNPSAASANSLLKGLFQGVSNL